MNDDSKLKLDYSSIDQLYKWLKNKKISNDTIELIINAIQDLQPETFVIDVVIKFLIEKVYISEQKISDLQDKYNTLNENLKQLEYSIHKVTDFIW